MRGLTLIETMLYVSLLALFTAAATSLGWSLEDAAAASARGIDREEAGRTLLDTLGAVIDSGAGPLPQGSASTLSVPAPDDASGAVVVRYDESARTAFIRDGADGERQLAPAGTLDALSFTVSGGVLETDAVIGGTSFRMTRSLRP